VYQQKLRLATGVLAAGDYRIGYSAELTNSERNRTSGLQIDVDDGTTVAEAETARTGPSRYQFISGFVIYTFAAGAHSIDIEYKALSETAMIRRARLEIYPVP
jgi:hypothetical protein